MFKDVCIPCDADRYNVWPNANSCTGWWALHARMCRRGTTGTAPCSGSEHLSLTRAGPPRSPDATNCSDPDVGSALLPDDGFWHSNVFSEQIHECPNPKSCAAADRGDRLRKLQAGAVALLAEVQKNATFDKAVQAMARLNVLGRSLRAALPELIQVGELTADCG